MVGVSLSVPGAASAQVNSSSDSKFAAIVIDAATGEVMYARRADSPRYPASISKLMTLYLTFDALSTGKLKLTDEITMSRHAASMQPTKLGVRAGRTITVDEAIQAICIKSANDVAVAMAEHLGGSETRFGALMTLKAHQLGMSHTNFINASGLPDPRQVSSARDIALLSQALMRDFPQYYRYFGQRSFTYGRSTMNNHNNLLRSMPGVDGLKTGYTNASGYNLAASAVRDNTRLITVVLGGASNAQRDDRVAALLNTGFQVAEQRDQGLELADMQTLFEPRQYARIETPDDPNLYPVSDVEVAQGDAPAAAPRGDYMVQVGAFKQRSQAQTQIRDVNRRFGDVLGDFESDIGDRVNGFFRARFKGMTEEAARSACATLKASRVTCMVIGP